MRWVRLRAQKQEESEIADERRIREIERRVARVEAEVRALQAAQTKPNGLRPAC